MGSSANGMVIEIRDLRKTYQMGATAVHALAGISVDIRRNEYVAIMGPSGSGKSTLLNIIGCLDVPTSGTYVLNGQRASDMDDDQLPRSNALHNVELPLIYSGVPARERAERARRALQAVGLGERMEHRPNELSGGQRQRVAIARALVNDPAIILADEPTGALDSRTGEEIMELFNRLHREGNTIILVTHEEPIARHSHRIVRLRDGRIESDERLAPGAVSWT